MNAYLRIAGYDPQTDVSFIADSNGHFPDLWEFSSYLTNKGIKIIAVSIDDFGDGNLARIPEDKEHIVVRACTMGRIARSASGIEINGKYYKP